MCNTSSLLVDLLESINSAARTATKKHGIDVNKRNAATLGLIYSAAARTRNQLAINRTKELQEQIK